MTSPNNARGLGALTLTGLMALAAPTYAQSTPDVAIQDLTAEQIATMSDEELAAASGEVVVTQGRRRATVLKPVSEEEVAAKELVEMPGSRGDALLAMKSMAGVAKSEGYMGAGGDLIIRGAAAEDSIYLIDGLSIPITMHFGNLQSVLPTHMMSGISYVPGGFGVEYGSGTGGMVHIKTSEVIPEKPTGFAELSFINAAVYIAAPLWKQENVSFQFGMRRSLIDAILPSLLPDDLDLKFSTYPQYYDAQLKIDWHPNYRHHFYLNNIASADYIALTTGEENPNDPMDKGSVEGEASFWLSYGVWDFEGEVAKSRVIAAVGGERLYQGYVGGPLYELKPRSAEIRGDVQWDVSPGVGIRVGSHVKQTTNPVRATFPRPNQEGVPADPNLTSNPALNIDVTLDDLYSAQYMAVDLRLPQDLRITTGARLDYYGHIERSTLSPRISISYPIFSELTALASLGKYSRPLHLAEAIPKDLHPEISTQAQIGLRHRFSPELEASITAFRTDYEDLVVQSRDFQGEDINLAYENGGKGRAHGAEVMVRMQKESIRGWLAYTYSRSYRTDYEDASERLFDHDQPHNLVAVANWHWGGWQFGGKFQVASGLPYTPVENAIYLADKNVYQPVHGGTNSDRLETSHQLDARIARDFSAANWNFSAYLDITNVYANAPVTGYSYGFDYKEREADTGAPILPAIGLKGEF